MEARAHGLTVAYALDALDADERRAYEEHLVDCERCRDELASFWQTTEALAIAATGAPSSTGPSPEPSPELRDRILAEARSERQIVVPLEPRRRSLTPVLGAAAAIAAGVALAVGLWAAQVSGDLDDTRLALDDARAAAAVLADPEARNVPLTMGEGRLVVAEDGRAAIVLHGLDPAPAGKTYELWIAAEGVDPAPAGLFSGEDEPEVVALEGAVKPGEAVLVTVEDAGGVEAPSTQPIVASEPVTT
jgi:anti-sigma factor RsiW